MIFCRFGSNFHELSFPAPARGCQSLADVKNEYEALGYCIYHQVDDGVFCFKDYSEYKKFLITNKIVSIIKSIKNP